MTGKKHVLEDFQIGESVVLLNQRQLIFVVTDIDKVHDLVVCRIKGMTDVVGKFKPEELQKENLLRPPNIVDIEISEDE